jgi:hypothetical protein
VTADLERDLGAWAAGALSRERLLATHGADAAGTVAVHERLAELAAGIPVPDPEAGWAALVAMIEAPAAVVPLRRSARRRTFVSLLVAAAIVTAGSAFAVVRASSHDVHPPSGAVSSVGVIPSSGPAFGPSDRSLVPPPTTTSETSGPAGPHRPSHGGTSSGGDVRGATGSDGTPATDDPHDRDHGTGNDGSHNDRGGGNDGSSGTLPHESHGGGH